MDLQIGLLYGDWQLTWKQIVRKQLGVVRQDMEEAQSISLDETAILRPLCILLLMLLV